MPNDRLSHEQISAQEARSYRALVMAFGSFLALLAASILLFLAARADFIPMGLMNFLVIALLVLWLLFIFLRVRPGMAPPEAAFGEEYWRKTIDIQHRRWRITIVITLLMLCELAYILTHVILKASLLHSPDSDFGLLLISWTFAFSALLAVHTVAFGPGFFVPSYRRVLNDELVRAQHAKTVKFGYLLAIVEMCAVLVMAVYRPRWVIAALPSVIAVAIVLPGIYFLILEWRAGRDA